MKHNDGEVLKQGTEVLHRLLQQAVDRPQTPVIGNVERTNNGVEVTITPPEVDHPVTLELTIVGATVIPWRPRRKRKKKE